MTRHRERHDFAATKIIAAVARSTDRSDREPATPMLLDRDDELRTIGRMLAAVRVRLRGLARELASEDRDGSSAPTLTLEQTSVRSLSAAGC